MQQIKDFIARNTRDWSENSELELRIGTYKGKYFTPGITQKQFYAVKRMFFKNSIHSEITDTIYVKDPVRMRNDEYLQKETKVYRDFQFLGFRMAYNIETQITNHTFTTPVKMVRNKLRWSVDINNWRVDLTSVKINGIETYELELELITPSENSYNDLLKVLFMVYPIVFYFLLTGKSTFIGNQPKTLEIQDIQTIKSQYSVTDKADGERKLLLITEFGNILIDKHLRTIHYPYELPSTLSGTLLDGEYIDKKFYAFDCLYYQRACTLNIKLTDRLRCLNTIPIETKKFYMDIADIHTIRDTEYPYKLDGLIFTPINQDYYGAVYKWKDIITIDVLYNDGKFYTRDRGMLVDVQTLGIVCKDLNWSWENNFILELKPKNDNTGEFTVLTERFDKTEPNALLTVKSALRAIEQNIDIYNI